MSSREMALWLDERWYEALSRQLKGETVEDKLNNYLDELISQLPEHTRETVSREIWEESQRREQELEASRKYSAFRVTEKGVTEYFQMERAVGILDSSAYVRRWLRQTEQRPLRELLPGSVKISAEEYEWMAASCVGADQKITGVYDIDLDAQKFSHIRPVHGWVTYQLKDVSTANWNSYRSSNHDRDRRLARLMEKLEGKALTSPGHLSAKEISFADEICEMDGHQLNFYLETNFDVDAVFGTHVCTSENDDTLNVYANYDMTSGKVCDELEVDLHRADGREESMEYRLNAAEKAVLLRKMDEYCQQQTGQSLADYSAQLMAEDMTPLTGPVM